MPRIRIDGKTIEVEKGATILDAARKAGIDIPTFCHHPSLHARGTCRMCAVEVEKSPKLMTACSTEAADGMIVRTDTPKVKEARKQVLEFLFANHPLDCPICDQAGECRLQDYYMEHGLYRSRFRIEDKNRKPKRINAGKHLVLDNERCVLCTRCVRFCEEITKTGEVKVMERGDRSRIEVAKSGVENPYSLNIAEICPVGAFTSRDFRFRKRVWFLSSRKTVCRGCATLCAIKAEFENGRIYRITLPGDPPDRWLCDKGRMTYRETVENVLTAPILRKGETGYGTAVRAAAEILSERGAESLLVLSPYLSAEDNIALLSFARTAGMKPFAFLPFSRKGVKDGISMNSDEAPNSEFLRIISSDLGIDSGPELPESKTVLAEWKAASALKDKKTLLVSFSWNKPEKHLPNAVIFPIPSYFSNGGTFVDFTGKAKKAVPVIPPAGEMKKLPLCLGDILSALSLPCDKKYENELLEKYTGGPR